jgi:hypothetical protein
VPLDSEKLKEKNKGVGRNEVALKGGRARGRGILSISATTTSPKTPLIETRRDNTFSTDISAIQPVAQSTTTTTTTIFTNSTTTIEKQHPELDENNNNLIDLDCDKHQNAVSDVTLTFGDSLSVDQAQNSSKPHVLDISPQVSSKDGEIFV